MSNFCRAEVMELPFDPQQFRGSPVDRGCFCNLIQWGLAASPSLNSACFFEWLLRLLSFIPSLSLSIAFILSSCDSTRQGWRFCSRGKRHHQAWLCLGAPGDRERSGEAMWMAHDKRSTYCEHFWANWNFTLTDRYCMETMKDTSEEKMETLKSMIHTFWAEVTLAALASQSRKVHRSIVGRCGFEALGWLWQDQVVLRGGWWWCNRWQHVKHRFDVHKTQVADIEMSLSQVLERISNVLFH